MKRRHITNPLFSLVEFYEINSQKNSPLYLHLTLYLKSPPLPNQPKKITDLTTGCLADEELVVLVEKLLDVLHGEDDGLVDPAHPVPLVQETVRRHPD